MYDKVTKYLPLLTILVFLLGYAYQDSYYKVFNIDILLYENNSEILYTLLPLSILIFGSTIGLLASRSDSTQIRNVEEPVKKRKKINHYIVVFIVAVLLIALQITLNKFFGTYRDEPFISLLLTIAYILTLGFDYFKNFIKSKELTTYNVFIFTLICGYLLIQYAKSSANVIKKLGNENDYVFFAKKKLSKPIKIIL